MSTAPLPVNLITGLLGSGKTTTLKYLLSQKPPEETWGVIINEFGEIGIDAESLDSSETITTLEVSGGCICCTAHLGLQQALHQMLNQPNLSRLLIEPTGLGHPAKIFDILRQEHFGRPLKLQSNLCILNPQHLTPERWQKSAVMRDLITLADVIILNKTDLAKTETLIAAHELLDQCYPPKPQRLETQQGKVTIDWLYTPHQSAPFVLLAGETEHQTAITSITTSPISSLPEIQRCQQQTGDDTISFGWVFSPTLQFKRTHIHQAFQAWAPYLRRGKGLLKTGNEWQLINWADGQLSFDDVAWRQDNRLELIFDAMNCPDFTTIEKQLMNTLHQT